MAVPIGSSWIGGIHGRIRPSAAVSYWSSRNGRYR
jgi:hypothetical protein